jgi:hypothetical protein
VPAFLGPNIPKRDKIYLMTTNYAKIEETAANYSKWSLNMPTFSIQRPSKIHPNWDIWSEIKPSGNPGFRAYGKVLA